MSSFTLIYFLAEIGILLYFCNKVGKIAVEKGHIGVLWQVYTVLFWTVPQFIGGYFSRLLGKELEIVLISAFFCGLIGILFFNQLVAIMPNSYEDIDDFFDEKEQEKKRKKEQEKQRKKDQKKKNIGEEKENKEEEVESMVDEDL